MAVDFPVRVKALRFSVNDARLADLSVSGARIEAKIEARLLSCVQIAIVLPRWPGRASPLIEAYVARNYEDGFGIEWCEFAPRIVSELLRGEAMELDRWEDKLRVGPGWLGPKSPLTLVKVVNGFGTLSWYYEQLQSLANTGAPVPRMGLLSALIKSQKREAAAAKALAA